jgi:hypothetical protein
MLQRFREANNPNLLVGIFLLVMLAVFAGPNALPSLIARVLPAIDEAIPCEWLRQGINRAQHQSLIGRAATNPLALRVTSSAIPSSPSGELVISILVINDTIGTVPIVYNPNQVIVGDNGTSGLGIVFSGPTSVTNNVSRQDSASVPESNIRVLGPRQRCIHKVRFAYNTLDANVGSGALQVRAFYRSNNRGTVSPPPGAAATPIYPDQGLWTGYIESEWADMS